MAPAVTRWAARSAAERRAEKMRQNGVILLRRRHALDPLRRHQVRHVAAPDTGGRFVAMAGGVRLDAAHAVFPLVGTPPGDVAAFALTAIALHRAPDREHLCGGVGVREILRIGTLAR